MKHNKYFHLLLGILLLSCDQQEEIRTISYSLSESEWIDVEEDDFEEEPDFKLMALDSAVLLNPSDPNVYLKRAHYLEDKWDRENALRDYDKAIELDPKNSASRIDRAIFFSNSGRTEKSIDAYLEILEFDPNNADALNNLAGIIMDVAWWNNQEAIDLLQDKLGITIKNKPNEDQPDALKNELYDIAILYYNKALKVNPKMGIALGNSALCMFYQGKIEKACTTWKRAYQLGDESAYGYLTGICEN